MKKLRMLSLFSGIGGSDLAAERTGCIDTVAMCDNVKERWEVLNRHFPGVKIYDDVKALNKNMLVEDGIINENEKIDIMSMSPPCQPFATCGLQKGIEDERHLTPRAIKLIKELQPFAVILENVPPFAKVYGAGDEYIRRMERAGYISKSILVQGNQFGAVHKRERFYCVSFHRKYTSKILRFLEQAECNNQVIRSISPKVWNGELKVHNRIPELINIDGEWLENADFAGWSMGFPRGWNNREIHNKKNNNLRLEEYGNSIIPQVMTPLFQFVVDCWRTAA